MNSLQFLSVSELQKLSLSDLETLARGTSGSATRRWLMLGRCLLVLGQGGRIEQCGCSGTVQYAGLLGIKPRDAVDCKRVAFCLEDLPLLRAAAEAGRMGWGALCEVTQKATPETESRWLELADSCTLSILEKLVQATPRGQLPCNPELVPSLVPEESWIRMKLPAYVVVMLQRAVRQLSLEARTPVSVALCQELVLAEFLAGTGASRDAVEKLRQEARKDVAARRRPVTAQQLLLESNEEGQSVVAPDSPGGSHISTQETIRDTARVPGSALRLATDNGAVEDPVLRAEHQDESEADGRSGLDAETTLADPPLAVLAGRGYICPSQPSLRLVVPDTDLDWVNPRLRFSAEARLATDAQRRELLRRDGYACSVPGCPHRLWLALHHVVFYCEGGVTLPANLIVVCTKCHRNIHKGRLRVTGTAPDGLQWTTRRGHPLDRPLPLEPGDDEPECRRPDDDDPADDDP